MPKPKALLLGDIDYAVATWEALSDVADLVRPQAANRVEFIEECRSGRLDGVAVVVDRAPASFTTTGTLDAELVEELPASVQFICHTGAGYDSVDVAACAVRGIRVSNTPLVVDDATADTAIFLALAALRGFNNGILAVRNGGWTGGAAPPPPAGRDPQGKVLGILGMGGVGRRIKTRADVFGMRVIYHNRTPLSDDLAAGARYVSFDELLAESDVLSLNLPLNANTRNIISTREFAKMKRGIVVINTARGGVLDEDALVEALDSGQVLSAGLDVFAREPDVHPGLLANPHVCLLPHMGTFTVETKTKMEECTLGNARMALENGRLDTIVPEHAHLNRAKE